MAYLTIRYTTTAAAPTPGAPPAGSVHYTTSEQDTGLTWTDSRPVYQKTLNVTGGFGVNTTTSLPTGVTGMGVLVDASLVIYSTTSGSPVIAGTFFTATASTLATWNGFSFLLSSDLSTFSIFNGSLDRTGYAGYLTFRYTKAADATKTPNAAFINYSTTEQNTGLLWIDSTHKVYQKSILVTAPGLNTYVNTPLNIVNISRFVDARLVVHPATAGSEPTIPLPYFGAANSTAVSLNILNGLMMNFSADTTSIQLQNGNLDRSADTGYLTLLYTCTDR